MRIILGAGLAALAVLLLPASVLASVGVGVGTGRINIDESIKPGSVYKLPPISVFNTGSEPAEYTMEVTLNESQPEIKPKPSWFSFTPKNFKLEPGKSQVVVPYFHPPLVIEPGNYFAFLEAHPSKTVQQGTASVGVAAATKLSFKVGSANILLGIMYRIIALFKLFAPWSYIAVASAIIGGVYVLFRRYFNFSLRITKV